MKELSTINQLADSEGHNPRTFELALLKNGVHPVAQLHGQKRKPFLYDRAEAKRVITAALIEGSKRCS